MAKLSNGNSAVHFDIMAVNMGFRRAEPRQCGIFLITYAASLHLHIVRLLGRGETIQDANQPLEINHAESRTAGSDFPEAIELRHVRHADRNGRQCAVRSPVDHTVLTPVRAPTDDIECLAPEGMERVSDGHGEPGGSHTRCS